MAEDPDEGGEAAAAALELTVLSLDCLKRGRSSKPLYAVAWLDPVLKQSTRAPAAGDHPVPLHHQRRLYFPLPAKTLGNAGGSSITIEVLSPSRLPLQPPKLLGSAVLPLSSVRIATGRALSLPLRRPSGRVRGTLRVSMRMLWDLGFGGSVTGVPAAEGDCHWTEAELVHVKPTAPPEPEQVEITALLEMDYVEPTAPPELDCVEPIAPPGPECVKSTPPPVLESGVYEQSRFWMGMIGGAVAAAVLVWAACRRLKI